MSERGRRERGREREEREREREREKREGGREIWIYLSVFEDLDYSCPIPSLVLRVEGAAEVTHAGRLQATKR